jgi:glycosyltransferase involved in cell wall biosynthesis
MPQPLVTVIVPVYNAASYVRDAVLSLLTGTYRNVQIVALDDGSTDGSAQVLQDIHDSRLQLVSNPRNLGLIATLNRGLDLATGDYVARMDADDLSTPRRLEWQVAFLEQNPRVGLAGGWCRSFGDDRATIYRPPADHREIRTALFAYNVFIHGAMMLRSGFMREYRLRYAVDAKHAEDLELWMRCVELANGANIPKVLLRYRVHANQVSSVHSAGQMATLEVLRRRQLLRLYPGATEVDLALHLRAMDVHRPVMPEELQPLENWLLHLLSVNDGSGHYDRRFFRRFVENRWLNIGHRCRSSGIDLWRRWSRSPLAISTSPSSLHLLLKKALGR